MLRGKSTKQSIYMRTIILIITILLGSFCGHTNEKKGSWNIIGAEDIPKHLPNMPASAHLKLTWHAADTTKTPKVDSLDMKVFSMRDLGGYLDRINITMQSQLKISEMKKYEQLVKIIQAVYADADKKRKQKN